MKMMTTRRRAEYFREYNKKSKVKSIRMNDDLLENIQKVVLQQGTSFQKVVLQLIKKSLLNPDEDKGCITTKLQQFYNFFLKNVDNLDFDEEDIEMFKEVEGIINV